VDSWVGDPRAPIAFVLLGLFTGPFSLDSALKVACDEQDAGPLDRAGLIDAVQALVDASLLVLVGSDAHSAGVPGDGPSYRLLETPRLYALHRLHEGDQHEALRRRHLTWCLAWMI
jgi:predicted ATPase